LKYWRKPLDLDRHAVVRGQVCVIKERCKGCGICVAYCPRGTLEMSAEFNAKGYHPPYAKNEEKCVGCDLCQVLCPEFAIFCTRVEIPAETPAISPASPANGGQSNVPTEGGRGDV
jgi:2-oxoglutarate ferredoxin oxidoreductase subunit delta